MSIRFCTGNSSINETAVKIKILLVKSSFNDLTRTGLFIFIGFNILSEMLNNKQ